MTAPEHMEVDDVVDAPPTEPDNRGDNIRNLVKDRDATKAQADAYRQVLDLVGIPVDDDGGFNPADIEEWAQRIQANNERARQDLLREVGFRPDSPEGMLLAAKVDSGELAAAPEALAQFAQEHGWRPNQVTMDQYYNWREAEQIVGQQRLDALHASSTSEAMGPLGELEQQIADARAEGDYLTASKLQTQYERKNRRV